MVRAELPLGQSTRLAASSLPSRRARSEFAYPDAMIMSHRAEHNSVRLPQNARGRIILAHAHHLLPRWLATITSSRVS
jgi:hypothetical protein